MGDAESRSGGGTRGFAGAVLAGGRSTRMGRDKAFVELAGRPLAAVVLGVLRTAGATPVIAAGGDLARLEALGFDQTVADRFPGEGPLGGLVTALGALPGEAPEVVVVLACDMPWVTAAATRTLVAALDAEPRADVAMGESDRLEPLFAAWRRGACLPALEEAFADGVRAPHRALSGLVVQAVPIGDPDVLRSANRPSDLPG